jgi:hypothetical protein
MSDILSRLTAEDAPEAREVTIGGETFTVYFRRITAGQRLQLLKGMKIANTPGQKSSFEIDLGENERQRHLLVHFSVCDEQGRRLFRDVRDVQNMQGDRVSRLADIAQEVNRETDNDLGKD